MKLLPAALACALYLCVPSVVFADPVPDPIVCLITEAARTGNPATLATAVDLSKNTNVAVGATLAKDGIDWRHKIIASANYQRSNGTTTANRYLASYEADYKFTARLFALGLVQWEQDKFAGFNRRFTESPGLGYSILTGPEVNWQVSGGPAWRQTKFVTQRSENDTSDRLG